MPLEQFPIQNFVPQITDHTSPIDPDLSRRSSLAAGSGFSAESYAYFPVDPAINNHRHDWQTHGHFWLDYEQISPAHAPYVQFEHWVKQSGIAELHAIGFSSYPEPGKSSNVSCPVW